MDPSPDETDQYARQFIDSRGSKIHNTFGVESYFNTSTCQYELKEVHELRQTLQEIKEKEPRLVDDLEVDPVDCTWEDVLVELQRAQDAALDNETRSKKWYRRPFRWMGEYAPFISPGLSCFPDFLGPIHGGLAVLLSMARGHEQNRIKVIRAVESIANAIHTAQNKQKNFPRSHVDSGSIKLHECIDHLQLTLLRTLPELIHMINPETKTGKATKSFNAFRTPTIDRLLDDIFSSSEKLKVCAEGLMDDVHIDTHKIAIRTRGGVEELQSQMNEVLKRQDSLQELVEAISGKNWLLELLRECSKPQLHRDHNLPPSTPPTGTSNTPYTHPPAASPSPAITTTPFELLNILSIPHLTSLDDEFLILRRGHALPDDQLVHAASMLQSPALHHLLQSPEPGIVMVDGCADRATMMGTVSPVSFVCANLAGVLRGQGQQQAGAGGGGGGGSSRVVMVFFCGQHVASNDPLAGPQGLVRSLLAQLVLLLVHNCWLGDSEGIGLPLDGWCYNQDSEDGADSMMLLGLPDLCRLFHGLLRLVPRDAYVFCIVDGVSYYERDVWRGDYEMVLGMLGGIVLDENLGGLFKVLLTSPTISRPLPGDRIPHQKIALRNVRGGAGYGHGTTRGLGVGRAVYGYGYGYHQGGPSRVGGGQAAFMSGYGH